jgi:hypothetical protein
LTTPLGTFSNGLNVITNNTGFTFGLVNCLNTVTGAITAVQFCGQGGVLASGRLFTGTVQVPVTPTPTPYDIFDNVDYTISLQSVPEPGTLALLSLGLFGIGFAARRKIG